MDVELVARHKCKSTHLERLNEERRESGGLAIESYGKSNNKNEKGYMVFGMSIK